MTLTDRIKILFGGNLEEKGLSPYTGQLPTVSPWARYELDVSREYAQWKRLWSTNPIVQGCVSAYALTMPEGVLSVRKGDELTREHGLIDNIIRGTGTPMSEKKLWTMTYTALAQGGDVFWHKVREGSAVVGVRPYTRQYITPIPNATGGVEYYHFKAGNVEHEVPIEDIVHISGFWIDPDKPWQGASPIELASVSASSYNEAQTTVYSILKNDAVPRKAFNWEEELSKEQQQVMKATFEANYGGQNRGKSAQIWGLKNVFDLAMKMDDLEFNELTTQFEASICSTFRVHPIVAMTAAGLLPKFDNFSEAFRTFTTYSRIPLWDLVADQIERSFRLEYGDDLDIEFDLSEVGALQPDPTEERTTAMSAFAAGVITRDEARDVFGLDAEGEPQGEQGEQDDEPVELSLKTAKTEDDDDIWIKQIDAITEEMTSDLARPLSKVIGELEKELIKNVKSAPPGVLTKRDPFNVDDWLERFLAATKAVREGMVEDLINLSLDEVGSNLDEYGDAFTATREAGIDVSSANIKESVGTIRDDVRKVLRETAGKKPDEITEALKAKFSTLKESRARMIARTTATATTGTTQRSTWAEMNEREEDPKRKIVRRWVALPGARKSHAKTKGQYENEDGEFKVGRHTAKHPADSSLPVEEVANCRCYTRPVRASNR